MKNFYELYRQPPELFEPNETWKIFLACKRGRSHIATGKVCQDYCVAKKITDGIFVVAVADGHGGDDYVKSDIGSQEACNSVVKLAKKYSSLDSLNFSCKWTSPEIKEELFDVWQTAVLANYRSENPDAKDSDADIIKKYGTTLLFALVTKRYIILGQVGDGAILLFNNQNQSQLFKRHNPKTDSKTSSLASNRGIYSLIIESYKLLNLKFNKILLSTDGIYDKLDRGDNFARYANELAAQIREKPLEEILPFTVAEIDVSEKSSDDCTFGKDPIFVWHPTDKRNSTAKFTDPQHRGQADCWNRLPQVVKDLFIKTFVTNLSPDRAAERTTDVAWRQAFETLEKNLITCPFCKERTFSEVDKCFECEKTLPKTKSVTPKLNGVTFKVLSAGEDKKQISPTVGTKIRGEKISKNLPSGDLLQIMYNPRTHKIGAKNLSGSAWTVVKADGNRITCEPNQVIALAVGIRIVIIPRVAQLNVIALN